MSIGHNSISDISYIFETYYNDKTEKTLKRLPNLKQLNMDYMNDGYKTGNIFPDLQVLELESLSLRGNDISDLNGLTFNKSEYEPFSSYMQDTLKYLDLADNSITSTDGVVCYNTDENENLYVSYKLKNLSTLVLTDNQVEDIKELSYLNNIKTLRLGNNRIQDITPISNMKFDEGQLELNNQRLSTYIYKDENNSKKYQYIILPNIIQESKNANSIIYDKNTTLETSNCEFNYDKSEYREAGNLNVKIDCNTSSYNEITIRVNDGLADGTIIKYTFESYYEDDSNEKYNFNSQNSEPIETLRFIDKNLDSAIYSYLRTHREDYGITYMTRVPYIININRESIEQVTELDLSKSNISDIEGLQSFTSINNLDLSQNKLKNADQIKYMDSMEKLNISVNQLGNEYSFINKLYELKELNLSSNNITMLSNLETYVKNLNDNDYETKLQALNLGSNNITNIDVIGNFGQLTSLSLANNKIESIESLRTLLKLGVLDLSTNNISNIDSLEKLKNLNTLYIDNNNLTDIGILGKLNLTTLAISSNRISDITPLKNKNILKVFYANDNKISDVTAIDNASHNLLTGLDGKLQLHQQKLTYTLSNDDITKETITIELPQIFKSAKKETSMFYTVEDFDLNNCELSGTNSITVKPKELRGKKAVVTIVGGRADKTTFTIGQPPIPTIKYNPEKNDKKTKGKVEATLTFNKENVTIINNNGSNKFEFTDNGEFVFEYKDEEGFEGKETAKVDWIDNKGPQTTVEYKADEENKTVKVIITADEPMQSVEDWKLGDDNKKLTKIYTENRTEKIKVKDELGNESEVDIKVIIEKGESTPDNPITEEKLQTEKYNLNEKEKIITNVQNKTKLEDFMKEISIIGGTYKVVNKNGDEIATTNLITTGSKIITSSNKEYTIVVIGDVDEDGKVGIGDVSKTINEYVSSNTTLSNIQKKAIDFNNSNKIDISDVSIIVNMYTNL